MNCQNCSSEFTPRTGGKSQRFCHPDCKDVWETKCRRVGAKVLIGGRIGRLKQKTNKTVLAFPLIPRRYDERQRFFQAAKKIME